MPSLQGRTVPQAHQSTASRADSVSAPRLPSQYTASVSDVFKERAAHFLSRCYYAVKPLIPRWLQLELRSWLVLRKRSKYVHLWPIDARAAVPPPDWPGWPDGKRFALVLTHDVDTIRGLARCDRIARLEERLGFRSSFNFVCEGYPIAAELRKDLEERGFEVGIHGIRHNGNPFRSRRVFDSQAVAINRYLKQWKAVGFRCPSMYHNLDWISELDIRYDSSTFDTDPFEPQSDGVKTIFPFRVLVPSSQRAYIELPYTLAQDFTLFILMKNTDIGIWRRKLDWIADCDGMVLVNSHPDYMNFGEGALDVEEYPADYYEEFLRYVRDDFRDQYWHVLPKVMADFVSRSYASCQGATAWSAVIHEL